jgi:hypothetical protein
MVNAINRLAGVGSRVISDDIAFADEPFFNDGLLSQAVNKVVSQGVFYTTAAGNDGHQAYAAPWRSTTGSIGAGSGQPVSGTFFDFGGGNILQNITVATGGLLRIDLQWDAAFLEGGSSQPNYQVPNTIEAYIVTRDGRFIFPTLFGNSNNQMTNEAMQFVVFVNPFINLTSFALAIRLARGPAPTMIRWVNFGGDDPMAAGEGAPTIFGHTEAAGAVTVGAVAYNFPRVPESYSAFGGNLPILFDANGNRLATPDIRQKPDIMAADNVDVSFDIGGGATDTDGDNWPNFQGTSAAASQVAAGGALILQQVPGAKPAQITQHFKATALVIGTPGFDPNSGSGVLQLTSVSTGGGGPGGSGNPPSDVFEPNDTSDVATSFGLLSGAQAYGPLTINLHNVGGNLVFDQDWYRWTAARTGTFTATLGNIQAGFGDLHERVFRLLPDNSLQLLGSSTLTGTVATQSVTVQANAGDMLFVWVFGFNFALGTYNLNVNLQ